MSHGHAPAADGSPEVYFQYEDIDQQQESYQVGMWAFLVTEVMFFGALFLMYVIYRWKYQPDWFHYHEQLDWRLGAINTTILLASSLAAALAVHFSQKRNTKMELAMLGFVIVCAFGFLGVKTIEYGQKFEHNLFPNHTFQYGKPHAAPAAGAAHGGEHGGDHGGDHAAEAKHDRGKFTTFAEDVLQLKPMHEGQEGNPDKARLFFSLYFSMTGLHGLHVIIGILCFATLMALIKFKSPVITDYLPTEMVCLYWHFVDLVWIFLYPLFYLIPK